MATTHIGIRVPDDLYRGPEEGGVYLACNLDTGMEYTLYECLDNVTALIGASPDSGGETVWFRTGDLAEGMDWIDARL